MLFQILFALLAISVHCEVDESDVLVLGESNFDDTLANNDLVLVEFYAPWCGHCKKLIPEYAEAATTLKDQAVVIGKVDATIESSLAEKFGVKGYPTIKIFRSGEVGEYEGGRTAKEIVSYLKKQMGPAFKILASADDLTAFIPTEESADPVAVAFAKEGSSEDIMFRALAKKKRDDFTFAVVNDAAVYGDEKEGSIVLFKPFDDKKNVFSGDATEENVLSFLKENSVPLVAEIGPDNYKMYVDRGLPIMWLFYNPGEADSFAEVKAAYAEVAPSFRGLSFVYLDGMQYAQMVTKMALSGNKLPAVSIETTSGDHFAFDEAKDITAAALTSWLQDYTDGKLSANIRSEPIPENPKNEDGITVVVGETFNQIVKDESKDVLIEFYAPWCGHCKKLIPIYSELAKKVASVDSVVIAMMDSTANDASGIQVEGFPTIKFVRGGDNLVMDYNGARTVEGFFEFLQSNAATSFTVAAEANDEL